MSETAPRGSTRRPAAHRQISGAPRITVAKIDASPVDSQRIEPARFYLRFSRQTIEFSRRGRASRGSAGASPSRRIFR